MNGRRLAGGLLSASVLLFWLQGLRSSFSTLFGIIYDQIFLGPVSAWLGISNGLFLLALLVPLALGGKGAPWLRRLIPAAAALSRFVLSFPDPHLRYWASLPLLAAGSFYLADLVWRDRHRAAEALVAGLCLDQVLRALGHTYDLSFQPGWTALPLAWSALALVAAIWQGVADIRRRPPVPEPGAKWPKDTRSGAGPGAEQRSGSGAGPGSGMDSEPWPDLELASEAHPPGAHPARPRRMSGWLAGLSLGGWLFLETSLLSVPNAAAGWSGGLYPALAPGLLIATWAPLAWAQGRDAAGSSRTSHWVALLLPLGVVVGYFGSGPLAAAALLLAQIAAVLALIGTLGAGIGRGSAWLAAGGLWAVLANYLNAFAFTYPYTLPAMRGLGWLVYLLAVVPISICLLAASPAPAMRARWKLAGWAAAFAATLLVVWSAWPAEADPLPQRGLRLASCNIHYGYDVDWHFALEEQAQALAFYGVDVVALQEVDAARVTSYLVDDAYYLARRLRMNAAYLPTVEQLTGIAVLYKGEASAVRRQLLSSLQEQTGIVGVELALGGPSFSAFGVWIGLEDEDTLTQVQEALAFIGPASPAMLAGDFNAVEGDPQLGPVRQAGFIDPFELLGLLPAPTHPAQDPTERLDYVWLRGMLPARAQVADSLASDHRLVIVEAEALR